jgi:hypothetical protein
LFGDNTGETAKEMAFAVDDDLCELKLAFIDIILSNEEKGITYYFLKCRHLAKWVTRSEVAQLCGGFGRC